MVQVAPSQCSVNTRSLEFRSLYQPTAQISVAERVTSPFSRVTKGWLLGLGTGYHCSPHSGIGLVTGEGGAAVGGEDWVSTGGGKGQRVPVVVGVGVGGVALAV